MKYRSCGSGYKIQRIVQSAVRRAGFSSFYFFRESFCFLEMRMTPMESIGYSSRPGSLFVWQKSKRVLNK